MVNFLISTAMVLSTIVFVLGLIGAAMLLGRVFAGALQRLARSEPTPQERDIAQLLAETDPDRR